MSASHVISSRLFCTVLHRLAPSQFSFTPPGSRLGFVGLRLCILGRFVSGRLLQFLTVIFIAHVLDGGIPTITALLTIALILRR